MRKGLFKTNKAFVKLALLCPLLLALCGCAPVLEKAETIVCSLDEYAPYPAVVGQLLPEHRVEQDGYTALVHLEQGWVTEAADIQVQTALTYGLAEHWYPQYLATVVIAVDRAQTSARVTGWNDLRTAGERVAYNTIGFNNQMIVEAVAYGLEGENFSLLSAVAFLSALHKAGRLAYDTFDVPIVICYDYQAAALKKAGRSIEIVVPKEGTLAYEKGLLSREPLFFVGDADAVLLGAGLRLLDGRCDRALYPGEASYAPAARLAYDRYNKTGAEITRLVRREVRGIRLYSAADIRESQLLVHAYIALALVWAASIMNRALQKSVRRAALVSAVVLIAWAAVRLVKWQIVIDDAVVRYLWFGYFGFQLALSFVLLWMAWAVDKPDAWPPMPKWLRALAAADIMLAVLVLTNDAHGLVYALDLSQPNWSANYGYRFFYYVAAAFYAVQFAAAIGILLAKGMKNPRKRGLALPAVLGVLMAAYRIGYLLRVPLAWESDLTMVVGVFTLLFYEVAIHSGMIPVNTKYSRAFSYSPFNMQIVGRDGRVALASAGATPLDEEALAHVLSGDETPLSAGKDALLLQSAITGGYVVWQEDIGSLNRLQSMIEESNRRLVAANAVLSKEAEAGRQLAGERAKAEVMRGLEAELAPKIEQLSFTAGRLSQATDKQRETAHIALLLCYIKRRSELLFAQREAPCLSPEAWGAYLKELAGFAGHGGTRVFTANGIEGGLTVRRAALFYEFFFEALAWAVKQGCQSVVAQSVAEDGTHAVRLLLPREGMAFQVSERLAESIDRAGGLLAVKDLGDAAGISLAFAASGGDGGEARA